MSTGSLAENSLPRTVVLNWIFSNYSFQYTWVIVTSHNFHWTCSKFGSWYHLFFSIRRTLYSWNMQDPSLPIDIWNYCVECLVTIFCVSFWSFEDFDQVQISSWWTICATLCFSTGCIVHSWMICCAAFFLISWILPIVSLVMWKVGRKWTLRSKMPWQL